MRLGLSVLLALWGCTPSPGTPRSRGAEPEVSAQPAFTEADLARAVHDRVNAVRKDARLEALGWDAALAEIAAAMSADMAERGFFGHVDPDGRDPTARAAQAGVECRRPTGPNRWRTGVGENLYRTSTFRSVTETTTVMGTTRTFDWYTLGEIARSVVQGWMDSPGHRRNLLDAGYASQGIGVRVSGDDVFVTEALC